MSSYPASKDLEDDDTYLDLLNPIQYRAWHNFVDSVSYEWAMSKMDREDFLEGHLARVNATYTFNLHGYRFVKFNTVEDKMVFILRCT